MSSRSFKQRLREGPPLLGPNLLELATPGLAVTCADIGFDFLLFDLEHAPFSTETVARTILAARLAGLSSIIKLADLERGAVQRYLDYGAAGIQVPHVESGDELRDLGRWARYPPTGERSQVFRLGNTGFRDTDPKRYIAAADNDVLLIPMVETRRGVEALDSILAAGEPDVVFIGLGDLSSSYGVPDQMTHPTVVDAAQRIVDACRARGIALAVNAEDPAAARFWIDRGARMIAYSSDLGMIRDRGKELLAPFKDA